MYPNPVLQLWIPRVFDSQKVIIDELFSNEILSRSIIRFPAEMMFQAINTKYEPEWENSDYSNFKLEGPLLLGFVSVSSWQTFSASLHGL